MRAGVTGLGATDTAARYQQALSRARSHLEAATHGTGLTPRDNQGDDGGGFHWRVRVAPVSSVSLQQPGLARRPPIPVTLYQVDAWIAWGTGRGVRDVHLRTEQLAAGLP